MGDETHWKEEPDGGKGLGLLPKTFKDLRSSKDLRKVTQQERKNEEGKERVRESKRE